jgi:hypothetical protein
MSSPEQMVKQILVEDPAGNVVGLFEPASGSPARP